MKPVEYFYQIKSRHKIGSDYKLAEFLNISRMRISDYIHERRYPDLYASMQIANALNLDPLQVAADFEEQSEKNEKRREFWRDFLSRARKPFGALVLVLSFTAIFPGGINGAQEAYSVAVAAFMLSLMVRIMYIMLKQYAIGIIKKALASLRKPHNDVAQIRCAG